MKLEIKSIDNGYLISEIDYGKYAEVYVQNYEEICKQVRLAFFTDKPVALYETK